MWYTIAITSQTDVGYYMVRLKTENQKLPFLPGSKNSTKEKYRQWILFSISSSLVWAKHRGFLAYTNQILDWFHTRNQALPALFLNEQQQQPYTVSEGKVFVFSIWSWQKEMCMLNLIWCYLYIY